MSLRIWSEAQKTEKAMAVRFPKFIKIINPWITEHQHTPSKRNTKTTTPQHIKIALLQCPDEDKDLEGCVREK